MRKLPVNEHKITAMRKGGALLHQILVELTEKVRPGVTGRELDQLAEQKIRAADAAPAFKHYRGYPASLCVSVNDEVVHGIPSAYAFKSGDVVSLDLGLNYDHFYTDSAITVVVTDHAAKTIDQIKSSGASSAVEKLVVVTSESLYKGIEQVRAGIHTGDIGHAIQAHVEQHRLGVVRDLVGHGVGQSVHEEPSVPNYGTKGSGAVLKEGQTIAIEPMVTKGDWHVTTDPDGWTVRTKDGSLAAHFEHTVLVTQDGYEILT